jgi:hypothetical protein
MQYCKFKSPIIIAKIQKVSTKTTGIKYKFGIQVAKEMKNSINLYEENSDNIWEESIKIELNQLTDDQTFIVFDSGETIPIGYLKIPYHMVFDIKYDLIYKARLVSGGN